MSDYIRGLQEAFGQVGIRFQKHKAIDARLRREMEDTTSPDDIATLGIRLKANYAVIQELDDLGMELDGQIQELKEKLQEKELVRA